MGILEEAAGAFAAVEGVKKLDPNAGILTEGIAAVAGFEGTKEITELIDKKEEEKSDSNGCPSRSHFLHRGEHAYLAPRVPWKIKRELHT